MELVSVVFPLLFWFRLFCFVIYYCNIFVIYIDKEKKLDVTYTF